MEWVHLNVDEILVETEKAFKVQLESTSDGPGKRIWLPKSVIADPNDYNEGDRDCTISVEDWFADKEGLE